MRGADQPPTPRPGSRVGSHVLENRVPPPVVMTLCGGLGWLLAASLSGLDVALPAATPCGWAAIVLGLALNLAPKRHFHRAGTTVNPLRPDASTALVQSGLHRISRNPMYLGHAVILLGVAVVLGNAAALGAVPLYMAYVTRFQILPEERALQARFGAGYLDYARRVRRWL